MTLGELLAITNGNAEDVTPVDSNGNTYSVTSEDLEGEGATPVVSSTPQSSTPISASERDETVISDLPLVSEIQSDDVFAVEVDGVTYKVAAETLADELASIGEYSDIKSISVNDTDIPAVSGNVNVSVPTTLAELQGVLSVGSGGTGASSFTSDYVLVGNGANAIAARSALQVPASDSIVANALFLLNASSTQSYFFRHRRGGSAMGSILQAGTIAETGSTYQSEVTKGDWHKIYAYYPVKRISDGTHMTNRLAFVTTSARTSDGASSGYYEEYQLPAVDYDRSSNAVYQILTNKSSISVPGNVTASGGALISTASGTSAEDKFAYINFSVEDTTRDNTYSRDIIRGYHDHAATTNGLNATISPGGNLYVGGGESARNLYNAIGVGSTTENTYVTADNYIYLEGNANTIANRKGFVITPSHNIVPVVAETLTDNIGQLGTSSYRLAAVYAANIYGQINNAISRIAPSFTKGDTPSSSIGYDFARLYDKNGVASANMLGYIGAGVNTNGRTYVSIAAYRNTANSTASNALYILCDSNGNASYSVSDPAAFRSAINAYSTGGGTLTGSITISPSSTTVSPWNAVQFGQQAESTYTDSGTTYTTYPGTWAAIYAAKRYKSVASGTTTWNPSRIWFRQFSATASSGTRLNYREDYYLPMTADDLTANKTYSILTTKTLVTVGQGGTNASTASAARTNLQASTDINLASTDDTASELYAKLTAIANYHTATIYMASAAAKALSNNKVTVAGKGIISRVDTNVYDIMVTGISSGNALNYIFTWRVTSLTSSAITAGTVYRYTGTAL